MILYVVSIVFGLIIFLSLITLFSIDDHKAKIRFKLNNFQEESPTPPELKGRFLAFLDEINVPNQMSRLVDEQDIVWSGIRMTYHQFLSGWWLSIQTVILLVLLAIIFGDREPVRIIVFLTLVLLIFLAPNLYLKRQIRVRIRSVEKSLPDFLDILTLVIEAGLGFIPALKKISGSITGVLRGEIEGVLMRMDLGFSRQEALREMTNRIPYSNLHQFVEAIILSERLGTSLVKTLRVQAKMLRTRRRQRAEAKAQTAPIRIIPALVFFFLPSLLLIYLAPPILNLLLRR